MATITIITIGVLFIGALLYSVYGIASIQVN